MPDQRTDRIGRTTLAARLVLVSWLSLAAFTAPGALAQSLNNQIEILLAHAQLESSTVGVYVQDVDTGEVLVAIDDTTPMIPASNMKLLTTGAALAVFGPAFEFRTTLERAGDTIILRGSGDPALADPDLLAEMGIGVEDLLGRWVIAVRDSGPGAREILVDATVFDRVLVHPTWPKDQLNRWYAAEVSGLNFYTNVLGFYLGRDQPGQPPRITLEPATPWLRIGNRAKTVDSGQNTVWVARPATNNDMTIYGNLRQSLSAPIRVAVHDPAALAGDILAHRLEQAGLGRFEVRVAEPGATPDDGDVLSLVRTPIETVVQRCNVESHNLYAEALLKRLGRDVTRQPGSFETGAAVLRMVMQDVVGPADTAPTVIADGSGLSRDNRVSPRALGRWLSEIARKPDVGGMFVESLPRAGEEGTLAARFRDGRPAGAVRAKSGYIRGVSCLSGYVTDETTGRRIAFSVLVNDIPQHRVPISRVKELHEAIVRVADGWLAEQAPLVAGVDDLGG